MKYLFLVGLSCFCLASALAQSYKIRGKSDNQQNGKVYLYAVKPTVADSTLVDSATISKGKFRFKANLQEPGQYFLRVTNHTGSLPFIWDKNIVITLTNQSIDQSSVEHSPATLDWNAFTTTLDLTYEEEKQLFKKKLQKKQLQIDTTEMREAIKTHLKLYKTRLNQIRSFIESHPLSWVDLYLLCWYRTDLGRAGTHRLMVRLPDHLKKSSLYHQLDLALQEMN